MSRSLGVPYKVWKALMDKGDKLSNYMPYMTYDDETMTFQMVDGSIATIIEFFPLLAGGLDDALTQNIATILENLFTYPVPADTTYQFIVFGSRNVEDLIELWASRKKGEIGEKFARNRVSFYKKRELFKDDPFKPMRLRYFFTIRTFDTLGKVPTREDLLKFTHLREALLTTLNSAGLYPYVMDLKGFLDLMTELLNGQVETFYYNPNFPIREQILHKSLDIFPEYMKLGERYVSVITTKLPPDHPDMRAPITGDPFDDQKRITTPFLLTVTFWIPDQEKFKGQISQKQKILTLQSAGPMGLLFPKTRIQAEELNFALTLAEKGQTFVKSFLTYIVFGKDEKECKEAENKVLALLKLCGYIPQLEDAIKGTVFLKALPMGFEPQIARFLQRGKTVLSATAPHLCPILGDWRGTRNPVMLYFSRKGEIITLDLFDSPGNYNCVVSASSGSGKSFFVNDILLNYYTEGAHCFIIDIGGSYYKLCQMLDGEYIEFTEEEKKVINPFEFVRIENGVINEEDLGFVVPLISKMASGEGRLTRVQEGILEENIVELLKDRGTDATISDLYDHLLGKRSKEETELAKMLYAYAYGKYASYFNGKTTLDYRKNFSVLELQGIRGKKELVSVILLVLLFNINRHIERAPRGQRKLVVIDEAWDLLQDPYSAKFIENAYRIYRKYGASAISITQNISDLYVNDSGRAVADNSDFFFLLRQKPEAVYNLIHSGKLLLNDAFYKLLISLRVAKGRYSEIFFYTPLGKGVGRFIPDPFSYWMFTTNPDDLQRINEYVRQGYDVVSAVERIVISQIAEQ